MAREIKHTTSVIAYDSLEELDTQDKDLIKRALDAGKKAYAPYSNFYVGAALKFKNGEIYTGNNQENVSFPSGLCAERVAIFAAKAEHPKEQILSIAITAVARDFKIEEPVPPCGACRQVLSEYEQMQNEPFSVLLATESGKIYKTNSASTLLPFLFKEDNLKS